MSIQDHDAGLKIGAAAFHEGSGRKAHEERMAEVVRRRLDPRTGLVRSELVQERPCPLCGSGEAERLFAKNGFPHLRCRNCRMVYVSPILRPDLLERNYEESEFADSWFGVLLTETQREFDRPKFLEGLDRLEQNGPKGRVLDIGCGTGHFLELARDRGWEVAGLELHGESVIRCRGLGIPILGGLIEEAQLPDRAFQAVTLWDVLPHVPSPRSLLREIRRILDPGGSLLLPVANVVSLAARILRERCNLFSGHGYVNLYGPGTLRRLLEEEGFGIAGIQSAITELGVIENYLQYEDPYFGRPDSGLRILDWLTPEMLHERLLGYKLLVLAKPEGDPR